MEDIAYIPVFLGNCRGFDPPTSALGRETEETWYVRPMEVKLACFQACIGCRGVSMLRVTVDKCMPRSLWVDYDSFDDALKRPERRRPPNLRAAGVPCNMPAGMLVVFLSQAALLK